MQAISSISEMPLERWIAAEIAHSYAVVIVANEAPKSPAQSRDNDPAITTGWDWADGSSRLGFGDYEQTIPKRRIKLKEFMANMDLVVPWHAVIVLIEPR
ncbi:hypothetical protein [Cyanobium sp. CH-040]|uniref:hypothetical protein n=1 Tax=Cyanobium sp. CH-040 TaxID=2823708 RepID=UPI0020CED6D0|nr:hypothetical protein [Cyanobium sp. CH-040]MCP9926726.1 hypothetical protein [Cyanobium sp. CH-040]